MQNDIDECRREFEKWCLENGYSQNGHREADGRWQGWMAAYSLRQQAPDGDVVSRVRIAMTNILQLNSERSLSDHWMDLAARAAVGAMPQQDKLREALIGVECDIRGIAEGYVVNLDLIRNRAVSIYNEVRHALQPQQNKEGA